MQALSSLPGYDYGSDEVPRSPLSLENLAKLKQAASLPKKIIAIWRWQGKSSPTRAEDMVSAWRAHIGEQEHLAMWFQGPDAERYKAAVKPRFVQWVIDTCRRTYDQDWLDYQEEIGRRHTPDKKNATDHVEAPPLVPLRYLVAFTAVIVTTARDFLAKKGHAPQQIERMHAAWTKAVLLSLALWCRPYALEEWW